MIARSPCRMNTMDDRRNNREVVTVLFLCLLWYVVSSSSNVVGKMLLSEFPYPLTVTMVQLTSITLYSGPFFNLWGVRRYSSNITWSYYLRLIVPLALGKFLANVFSHVSIWKVPVSYAHTEVWLCPSEGYNAPLYGSPIKNNTSRTADMESLLEPCTNSRWRSDCHTDRT